MKYSWIEDGDLLAIWNDHESYLYKFDHEAGHEYKNCTGVWRKVWSELDGR